MLNVHRHKNVIAAPTVSTTGSNLFSFGQANFWYDASSVSYFTGAAHTPIQSGDTVQGWLSKFYSGTPMGTYGFGALGTTQYNLPNFYFNSGTAVPGTSAFTGSIAPGTASTFTGSVSGTTLTVTTAPTNSGVVIGYVLSGGTIPANTIISANQSGTANSTGAWTITNLAGTAIPAQASQTLTVTPIVLTVSAVSAGTISVNNMIVGTGVTAATYITALGTGVGGVGTYYVSISQTKTSGVITANMPYVGFNSGDAFRVPLGNASTLSGYTMAIAYKVGSVTGNVAITGSDHTGVDIGFGTNASVYNYTVSGATATGNAASTTGWHVHVLKFDGTQATNATRFQARLDGNACPLTFTGTVGTTTNPPATFTLASSTVSSTTVSGGTCTVMLSASQGTAPYLVGQNITLASWTTVGTAVLNGTQTVTACNANSISFSVSGTLTSVTTKGTIAGTPIPNLFFSGRPPQSGKNLTNATASTQGLNIGEVIMYNSALSPSSIISVEKYLRNKWANVAV
jgi:hypothetical protein